MKSSQEMTRAILDIEQKIATLNERIADHEKKKALVEQEHTRLIHENPSKGPGPGDLFERMLEHGLRADALRKARMDLEAKLDQAQAHLSLTRLHESLIPHFEETEPIFMDNLKAIENEINAINKHLHSLDETIEIFMQEAGNPFDSIEALLKNPLVAGLSLRNFFNGEIRQATPNENDDFIQAIGRKYLDLANGLPRLKDISDTWMLLSDRLDALARQSQNLIPSRLKYIPAAPAKPKPEHGSTMRIPTKSPAKKLTWGEKRARELRRAAALYR